MIAGPFGLAILELVDSPYWVDEQSMVISEAATNGAMASRRRSTRETVLVLGFVSSASRVPIGR